MKKIQLYPVIIFLLFLPGLSGCASMTRGAVEAVMAAKDKDKMDTRQCYVRGRPFEGLERLMNQQKAEGDENKPILKVLMVHGIGSHKPGYATQLSENLAQALQLPRVQEQFKEFNLTNPRFPDTKLGVLRVSRYLNEDGSREMQFFELTWDVIVQKEKETIAFDNSGEYSFRRAGFNEKLKLFVNDTVPDVIMYYGRFRPAIQASVAQSVCWMMSETWETLPNETEAYCDPQGSNFLDELRDNYVFITHSLGSRITSDAVQTVASVAESDERLHERAQALRDKEITIFMLSNQLPLLQLGREKPEVADQIDEICAPGAPRAEERLFKKTHIVAFSDPNDLFSYPIPPKFLRDHIDSRLCPTLTNVTLNISPVIDIFGLGELANPLAAHTGYDNDERVIKLITNGIGTDEVSPVVRERCVWTEAIPEKF
jgi:hypothetical protein